AEVIATNRSKFRLGLAAEMGATVCLNPEKVDVEQEIWGLTGGLGVDIVLESSGNVEAVRQGLHILRKGGTMLLIGLPSQKIELDLASEVILKELVVRGLYRYVRNPMYVGMAALLLAHAAARRSLPALTPAVAFTAWIDRIQIPMEEAHLAERFPEAFNTYCNAVPRWLEAPQTPRLR
ncbi:MAG: zinc-binding dehydrogenase, partial [Actinobacteria bacterium]|nr:zinc-binding dehydrogenase [Actinomycetota bacterium]